VITHASFCLSCLIYLMRPARLERATFWFVAFSVFPRAYLCARAEAAIC
jgi:hypothetical protein